MRNPWILSGGATLAIAAFVVGTLWLGPAVGAAAAAGGLVLAAIITFAAASASAAEDFFRAYADARGLSRESRGELPPLTPLLKKGDENYAKQIMRGKLPGGVEGSLALYTYEEHTTDSRGNRQTSYYHFTVVMTDVPESIERIPELYCERPSGFRFLDRAEDAFRMKRRLKLESEALDERFEIFVGLSQDENYCRQLFSPTFIVWLSEQVPEGFGFELANGVLCVSVKDHYESAVQFDRLCEAAAGVAKRLREEALESPA